MDDKTWACSYSQQAVAAFLAKHRVYVFTDTTGKAPIDLVAYRDGVIRKIAVKAVMSSNEDRGRGAPTSYGVQLRSTRYSRSSIRTTNFSDKDCDILAVFVAPTGDVALFWAADMVGRTQIEVSTVSGPGVKWIISDHQSVDPFFSSDTSTPTAPTTSGPLELVTYDSITKKTERVEVDHLDRTALGLNVIAVVGGSLCKTNCAVCQAFRRRIRTRTAAFA